MYTEVLKSSGFKTTIGTICERQKYAQYGNTTPPAVVSAISQSAASTLKLFPSLKEEKKNWIDNFFVNTWHARHACKEWLPEEAVFKISGLQIYRLAYYSWNHTLAFQILQFICNS